MMFSLTCLRNGGMFTKRHWQGEISKADRIYFRDDGTIEWTRWECRPWHEEDGSIGGIIVYTEVITDWIKAEEKLRRSHEKNSDDSEQY